MRPTALITGASSGIGYEFTKIFARNGYNLVLVSRDADKLNRISRELNKVYNVEIWIIPKDLEEPTAPQELYDEVVAAEINIEVLVNNAGIASWGNFTDSCIEKQAGLIQLNIISLTLLCRLFGADMAKRGSGRILNIASTAAFQAGPLMSTYYASKAYVLLFSEAINNELKGSGVTVTVLCPGPTQTEFFKRSRMIGTKLEESPYMMRAAEVAEIGFSGLLKCKTIVIPGLINRLLVFSIRLAPRRIVTAIAASLNKKSIVSL